MVLHYLRQVESYLTNNADSWQILIAGVIYAHVAAKLFYVRLFRGTKHMSKRTPLAIGAWLAIITVFWTIAFIIAMSIPTFNDLLSLISSLFASWFTYGLAGVLWLYLNRGGKWKKKPFLTILNVLLVLMGAGVMGMGLYASGTAIKEDSGSAKSWSCADNSDS
jgi:Transmembrane amino acid transporter protein